MISLADLFGFPPSVDGSPSDGPLSTSFGTAWPGARTSPASPFPNRFSATAFQQSSTDPGQIFPGVSAAGPSPTISTLGTLPPPLWLPPPAAGGGILGNHPAVRKNGAGPVGFGGILPQYLDADPGSSQQAGTIDPSVNARLVQLALARLLAPSYPSKSLPLPPPEASWAAPQLPLFPPEAKGYRGDVGQQTDDQAVLSDADPDAWIPNAQYANRSTRRGGRRASEPELSPAEEIRWFMYNQNLDVLGQLEPQNRLLFSIHDGRWVPSQRDLLMLEEEIARARREKGAWTLERQHNLPREFEDKFNACGLDIEDYVTYIARDLHRLRPNGLHTGAESWNKVWRRYFAKQQSPTTSTQQAEEIYQQLLQMWDNAQWLRQWLRR